MRIEYCPKCMTEILTTEQLETTQMCYDCGKKHAKQFIKESGHFKPEVVAKLKENGY